jgi:hypothetical protein
VPKNDVSTTIRIGVAITIIVFFLRILYKLSQSNKFLVVTFKILQEEPLNRSMGKDGIKLFMGKMYRILCYFDIETGLRVAEIDATAQ